MLDISCVICTQNRSDYLRKALQSVLEQTLPCDRYEIIVIDNGSTDGTAETVRALQSGHSNVIYCFDPIYGHSHARNTGWHQARGRYVAFLDDDAVAEAQWLEAILEVFATVRPVPGCTGGPIDLVWEAPQPAWLPDSMLLYLGHMNWSETPIWLPANLNTGGGNSAYPLTALEQVGGFPTHLGRQPNTLLSSEEVLVRQKLSLLGLGCFYQPDIRIGHHVPIERLTHEFFYRRYFWQGVSDARMRLGEKRPGAWRRLWLLTGFCKFLLMRKLNMTRTTEPPLPSAEQERFRYRCLASKAFGYVLGLVPSRSLVQAGERQVLKFGQKSL